MICRFHYWIIVVIALTIGMAGASDKEQGSITREELLSREKSMLVYIKYGNGHINLSRNQDDKLFRGEFLYREFRPDIRYEIVGDEGRLDIRHSGEAPRNERDSKHISSLDEIYDNEFNLSFTDKIPVDFDLSFGVIKGDLNFTGLKVGNINMEVGVSKTAIIFDEPNLIPMRSFSIEGGVGKLQVENLGNANLREFAFEGGIGSYELDFSGEYRQNLKGSIELGLGKLTLYLPRRTGVRLSVDKSFLSSFIIDQVYKKGDFYTNDQWGQSKYGIDLQVETGVGKIEVVWIDE